MPLFICSKCRVIENTALGRYWETVMTKDEPLCSQCDPKINKWHGRFERQTVDQWLKDNPNKQYELRNWTP